MGHPGKGEGATAGSRLPVRRYEGQEATPAPQPHPLPRRDQAEPAGGESCRAGASWTLSKHLLRSPLTPSPPHHALGQFQRLLLFLN